MSGVVTLPHLPETAWADHMLSCEELIAELLVILDDIPERSLGICGRLARLVLIIRQWSITHFSGSVWTQTPVLRIVATEYLHGCGYHVFLHL